MDAGYKLIGTCQKRGVRQGVRGQDPGKMRGRMRAVVTALRINQQPHGAALRSPSAFARQATCGGAAGQQRPQGGVFDSQQACACPTGQRLATPCVGTMPPDSHPISHPRKTQTHPIPCGGQHVAQLPKTHRRRIKRDHPPVASVLTEAAAPSDPVNAEMALFHCVAGASVT